MRVIAGAAKGRRLVGVSGDQTRPLSDRVKEALFSSLGPAVIDAVVLDLFAGSGSLGLEALSRGADSATFVERDRKALDALRRNVELVGLGGDVISGDVFRVVPRLQGPFDLVFVDPPYVMEPEDVDRLLDVIAPKVAPGGIVVVHRRRGTEPPLPPAELREVDRRHYGGAELFRYERTPAGPHEHDGDELEYGEAEEQ